MDFFKSTITCCHCKKIVEKPIVLVCGKFVCLRHVEHLHEKYYVCRCCDQEHKVNCKNLYISKARIDLGENYNQVYANLDKLHKLMNELDVIKRDLYCFIHETIAKLRNQTELIREECKLMIDVQASKVINELDEYERECKSKLETNEFQTNIDNIEQDMANVIKELNEWESILNVFDSKQEKINTIRGKSIVHMTSLKNTTVHVKQELLLKKFRKYLDRLEEFLKNLSFSGKNQFSLDLKQDLTYLFNTNTPYGNSKILNSTVLQNYLINLCEFDCSQKWSLLYSASEHGFDTNDFHSRCDNVPNTLTIIQSSNGNIFGGFTDVPWDSSNIFKSSTKAFVFSLINTKKQPFLCKIEQNYSQYAIACFDSWGPTFGNGGIYISHKSNICNSSCANFSAQYKNPNYEPDSSEAKSIFAGSYDFYVTDIEIYKLE